MRHWLVSIQLGPRLSRYGLAERSSQEATMADTKWTIKGREFVNCNCSYGCPCQFNGLPTHGHCQAVGGFEIEQGHHGSTKLDGLKFVGIFRWPGAIHEGKGEAAVVIDERGGASAHSRVRSSR
jgi:hypothetical protein